jgi:deoxycytidine triphosphate deaminase
MKNFTLITFFIMMAVFSVKAQSQMNLPVTFDDPEVNYGIVGFGGADDSAIVEDPTDANNKVARVTKTAVAELWAGATVTAVTNNVQTGFASRIPFTATQTKMSVRVWSPDAGIQVRLKVEDHLDPTKSVETEATTTLANGWQILTFDFANQAAGTSALNLSLNYNKASIFFNFGVTGAEAGEKTYYFDDMVFITEGDGGDGGNSGSSGPVFPVTFEEDVTWTEVITNFDGGELTVVDNPDTNGNASAKVGRMVKNAGQPWGGSFMMMGENIDLSTSTQFTVAVWAPRANTKMLFKIENENDGAQAFEQELTIAESNQWVDVTFDMGGANRAFTYKKVVMIFDLGTVGDGSAGFTWYVDNIRQGEGDGNGGGGEVGENLIINGDFAAGLNSWTPFIADFAGVSATVAASEGEASITGIAGAGGQIWHVQFNQIFTAAQIEALEVGQDYIAKFDARSSVAGRALRLYFGEDGGGFAGVSVTDHTLNTEMQTIEVPFNLGNKYGAMKFGFEMGLSNDPVFIRNVSLTKVDGGGNGGGGNTNLALPVTFDEDLDYGLTDFGGNASEIVVDPTDAANKVAKSVKSAEAELWAGTTVGGTAGFASAIPFASGATKMSLRVWSPTAGIPVRIKVEASNDPTISVETEATVTVASQWQTLTFDFANQAAGTEAINFSRSYNKASVFFNFGTTGAVAGEQTYYWDDLVFGSDDDGGSGGNSGPVFPVTFEEDVTWTEVITNFDGGELTVVDNPDTNGNPSAKVGRMVKNAGQPWGGSFMMMGENIDLTTSTQFTVAVWAPRANTKMLFKIENENDGAQAFEQELTIAESNQWVDVTFDMGGANRAFTYKKVVMIFDLGTVGDGSAGFTWYVDNIRQGEGDGNGGGGEVGENLIINGDFAAGLNSWTPFIADFAGVSATVAASEGEASITNIAGAGGQIWHVQFNQIFTAAQIEALEVGQDYIAKFDARSSVAGRALRLYFGEDGGGFAGVSVTDHTLNTEMQTIEVPFNLGNKYGAMKFGFEMGLSNDPVFIRNVSLTKVDGGGNGGGGNTNLALPVTFDEDLDYGLTDFGGNASEIVVDPTDAANKVAKSVKSAEAELWAGTTVGGTAGFANAIPFASGATKMSLRVWSPTAGIPVRLKVEASNDPTISVETEATVTVASQWQTLTFDFANQAAGTEAINFSRSYNKASVFFNFGTTGAVAGEQTYYWDDMAFGSDDDGGSGGSSGLAFPITFEEDVTWTEVITNFDGGELTVIDNPDTNGNPSAKVGRMVKNAGQPWGGSFMMMGENIDLSTSTQFTVAVWAPRANTKMLFKIENENDGAQAFEQELTIAESNQWVDVTFDMGGANKAFTYKKLVMIFDLGTVGDGSAGFTWYVDNIRQGEGDGNGGGGEVGENLIINGDFAAGLNSWTPFIADFAGVSATVAASEGEASITGIAGAGGQIWHVQFNQIFTAAQIEALEVGQDYIAKFDARSSVAGRALRLYFGEDGGGFAGVSVTDHTLNTEMQTIEVPFNLGNKYAAMKFGFEMGLSNDPVFIRNVSLTKVVGGGGGGGDTNLELPVTFENAELDYGLTDFGGNASEIVVDPTNAGNKVAKSVKTAEAELWAGTTLGGTAGFASAIPFANGATKMSLRVWSPTAGIPVRLKVEASNDPTISVETEATVTVASQWQTLTFDFANQATGTEAINFSRSYNKASVFFNFGTTGAVAGEQTYYWDDMVFGELVQEEQVITFPEIEDKTLGDAPFNLNASTTSGLVISFSSDNNNVSISGGIATLVNPGRTTITASQSGNLEFLPALPVSQSFCVNPAKPVISVTGQGSEEVTLTSSSATGNQWFLDGVLIADATGSSIVVSTLGTYTVQVTIDECVSQLSEEVTLIVSSARFQQIRELTVFPNPVENYLNVRGLSGPLGNSEMIDMAGRSTTIVFEELENGYQADVSRLSPGIYLLRLQQGNKNYSLKIIKK